MSLLCLYIEFHVIHMSTIVCAFELHEILYPFYLKDSNAQSLISFLEQKIFYTNRAKVIYCQLKLLLSHTNKDHLPLKFSEVHLLTNLMHN